MVREPGWRAAGTPCKYGMDNRFARLKMQPVSGMQTAQHLAVDQIKCALLRSQPRNRLMRVTVRMISGMMIMVMQFCDGFMGMPGGMTQRMGQCALLRRQQQQREHPSQSDGAQRTAGQRQTGHG